MRKHSGRFLTGIGLAGGVLLLAVSAFLLPVPGTVQGATIAANARLTGTIEWVENPPGSIAGFCYAILYIDGVARSITTDLPLRFELNTAKIPDGRHLIKVACFDANGKIGETVETGVVIANSASSPRMVTDSAESPITQPAASRMPTIANAIATQNAVSIVLGNASSLDSLFPYIDSGRVMVRLRSLLTAAGCDLAWQGCTGTAKLHNRTYRFTLHSRVALVDGHEVMLVRPLALHQDRVYAPICLWRDLFAGVSDYDPKLRRVTLGDIGITRQAAK